MQKVYDTIIVGAGPVGLFASFYAGLRGLHTLVMESREQVGGALSAIYPEKYIYDMVGFPKILAKELIDNLYKQSSHFNNTILFNHTVIDIRKNDDNIFEVECNTNDTYHSKSLVIATGMGAFTPRKLPALKKFEKYEMQTCSGIKYVIKNKEQYYNQHVAIVGGGNSALDWAHDFDGNSKSVSLIHREDTWQAHEESIEKLKNASISVYQPWSVVAANNNDVLKNITIQHVKTKEKKEIPVDLLLVNIGFLPGKLKFKSLPLEYKSGAIVVNPATLESNAVNGLFVAGDAASFSGKLKLICVGAAEAAIAVNHAAKHVDAKAKLKPAFSSNFFTEDFSKGKNQ